MSNLQKIGPSDILDRIWTDKLDNGKSNDFTVLWYLGHGLVSDIGKKKKTKEKYAALLWFYLFEQICASLKRYPLMSLSSLLHYNDEPVELSLITAG